MPPVRPRPPDVATPRRRLERRARRPFGRIGYLYIAPALVVYSAVVLAPMAHTFWLSLLEWDGLTPARFVGTANYQEVVSDEQLRANFVHAAVLIVFFSFIPVTLGLLVSSAMSRHRIRGFGFFRTVLFLPAVVTPAVVAITWRWIYAPRGSLNSGLRLVGLDFVTRPWLGDFQVALIAVGLIGTWVYLGLAMVLFLAGIQRLPTDMYEAARIDGAGLFHEIRYITIPSLRSEVVIVLTLTMIGALRTFDLIYLTTKGGPGTATEVPSLEIFRRAFLLGRIGSSAAIAITLSVVVLIVSLVIARVGERHP